MAESPISSLEAHLGYWLRIASNGVSRGFARKLDAHATTVAEWVLMRTLLGATGQPPSQLALQLGMTRGAITKLADRLIAGGFVRRTADPRDKRAQMLALTEAGREQVSTLAALADENDAEYFGFLRQGERATLERLLRKIIERRGLTNVPTD